MIDPIVNYNLGSKFYSSKCVGIICGSNMASSTKDKVILILNQASDTNNIHSPEHPQTLLHLSPLTVSVRQTEGKGFNTSTGLSASNTKLSTLNALTQSSSNTSR